MDSVEDLIRDLSTRLGAYRWRIRHARRPDHRLGQAVLPGVPDQPVDLVARAEELLATRRARRKFFPPDLFHEPAWEMLVALFIVYETDHSMNVKQLVGCSDAPATTSQRWIDHLHKSGLINRVTDTEDRRRIDISLSEKGYEAMTRYLSTCRARSERSTRFETVGCPSESLFGRQRHLWGDFDCPCADLRAIEPKSRPAASGA